MTYTVESPEDHGVIRGQVEYEHGREFVTGTMVNGEGEIRVAISQFNNEDVCDLKKASIWKLNPLRSM